MRIDKYISESTAYSRKDIKKMIKYGYVEVNGQLVQRPEMQVSEEDIVLIDGEPLCYAKFIYLMLNKPQGVVSATEDKHYRTVIDLVPVQLRHYEPFPVGRLDIDTEGLLLLTNDGGFAHSITSPKKNVYKRYFARLDKACEESDIAAFAAGMSFKEFTARPARLEICDNPVEAYVEIAEGKFHQVKRMFERVGKTVVFLKRTAIGGLILPQELMPGELREYTREDLDRQIWGIQ